MSAADFTNFICPTCKDVESPGCLGWDGVYYCNDCWPGYNMCANEDCTDYRVEHCADGSCHCGCMGFVEGSTRRVINYREFRELKKSWGIDEPQSGESVEKPASPESK